MLMLIAYRFTQIIFGWEDSRKWSRSPAVIRDLDIPLDAKESSDGASRSRSYLPVNKLYIDTSMGNSFLHIRPPRPFTIAAPHALYINRSVQCSIRLSQIGQGQIRRCLIQPTYTYTECQNGSKSPFLRITYTSERNPLSISLNRSN